MLERDDSGGSVYQRSSYNPVGAGKPREEERLLGHGRRTSDLLRGDATTVGSEHHVRVEHREKRVEVSVARGSEEGIDHLTLAGEIDVGKRGRPLHPAARPAR